MPTELNATPGDRQPTPGKDPNTLGRSLRTCEARSPTEVNWTQKISSKGREGKEGPLPRGADATPDGHCREASSIQSRQRRGTEHKPNKVSGSADFKVKALVELGHWRKGQVDVIGVSWKGECQSIPACMGILTRVRTEYLQDSTRREWSGREKDRDRDRGSISCVGLLNRTMEYDGARQSKQWRVPPKAGEYPVRFEPTLSVPSNWEANGGCPCASGRSEKRHYSVGKSPRG